MGNKENQRRQHEVKRKKSESARITIRTYLQMREE
jgi:hypothetical protein